MQGAVETTENEMSDLKKGRRDAYGYGIEIPTRWADCDAYGHVNNVVYYSWFDTALTRMLYEREVLSMRDSPSIGICVESQCEYFAPVTFPEVVEARVRIGRMGEKSLRYEVALWVKGAEDPIAAGHFVHVFVDRVTRQSVRLSDEARAAVADLVVEG
jgi:acyl-CoA thioester hydrolase